MAHEDDPTAASGSRAPGSRALWILCGILSLVATADSVWLYIIQLDYDSMSAACKIAEGFDCAPALNSPWGRLFGISLSSYGIPTYALFTLIALQGSMNSHIRPRNALLLAIFAGGGSAFCVWLAWVSTFRLQAYCPYCLLLHILTPVIFILSAVLTFQYRERLRPVIIEEISTLRNNKPLAAGFLVAGLLLVVGLPSFYEWKKEQDIKRNPSFQLLLDGEFPRLPSDTLQILGARPKKGDKNAAVTIIEFGDFTCGHCREFHYRMNGILKDGGVNFVFIPFPRSSECNPSIEDSTPGSCYSALVAKHAESKGRFWEVHNAVFDDADLLAPERAEELARIAGASGAQEILSDTKSKIGVIRDVRLALQLGVRVTPSVFINGMGIEGAPVDWFLKEIIRREKERGGR